MMLCIARQATGGCHGAILSLVAIVFMGGTQLFPLLCLADENTFTGDDFEQGMADWYVDQQGQVEIVTEPGTSNQVLQLTPKKREFVSALFKGKADWENFRYSGRFLFPADGDGYLGFIYHHQQSATRTDFGCLYVKSNGSYVRASPHYDGNPSWRLYEDFKFDLSGERRIEVGTWYTFRLDLQGGLAKLYIEDMTTPVMAFGLAPNQRGAIGLEARPGGGEAVWVDDIIIRELPTVDSPSHHQITTDQSWEIYGPVEPGEGNSQVLPEFEEEGWRPFLPDPRGALITGASTQFHSGEKDVVYLRTRVQVAEGQAGPNWLGVSTANRLDVWFRGFYRGTVAEERFIWADFLTSKQHPGARLSLLPVVGSNELIIRVDGRRFAGGGLFVRMIVPE